METVANSFKHPVALKERPHCSVYGLWVVPKVECGPNSYRVPVLHHSEFNYTALGELLGALFFQSARVQLRLPNDVIDVATFDERLSDLNSRGEAFTSQDMFLAFGKNLMRSAKTHNEGIIDIRKSKTWQGLKSKAGQAEFVYPPQVIPICILSNRAEDANWWYLHSLSTLGSPPLEMVNLARAFSGKPPVTKSNQGVLPAPVLRRLTEMFKVPFEPKAFLLPMALRAR